MLSVPGLVEVAPCSHTVGGPKSSAAAELAASRSAVGELIVPLRCVSMQLNMWYPLGTRWDGRLVW